MSASTPSASAREYGCGLAARWAPRVVAASLLASAVVLAGGVAAPALPAFARGLRTLVMAAGALLAVAAVRGGAEVRQRYAATEQGLVVRTGREEIEIPYASIDALVWEPAFARRDRWLPATALLDRSGRRVRIPASVAGGASLVGEIVRRSGRSDLAAWADTHRLVARMRRGTLATALCHAASIAMIAAALAFRAS